MNLSLNEIEVIAKKAARGAGYPWGLAEEAGKATRWLYAHDIDGCAALARLLVLVDGAALPDWTPDTKQDLWLASGSVLCPLVTGAAISDRAHLLRQANIRIGKTAEPAIMLAFAALAAQQVNETVTLAWPNTVATTDGDQVAVQGSFPATANDIEIRLGGNLTNPNQRQTRANPTTADWGILLKFAHRTYAPATEESRLRGAGSGVSDND